MCVWMHGDVGVGDVHDEVPVCVCVATMGAG